MGVSPSLSSDERVAAHAVAAVIGVRVLEVRTREGENELYVTHGPDRCYHCKDELFARISEEVMAAERLDALAFGENADDTLRPNARAAPAHQVLRPLADAGLSKANVRAVAAALGLLCADKPAAPCLASRIPHHSDVTPTKLLQVERAERALRELGFREGRVRHHGEVARVELRSDDIDRALSPHIRDELVAHLRAAGFRFVAVDLAGFQSGGLPLSLVKSD